MLWIVKILSFHSFQLAVEMFDYMDDIMALQQTSENTISFPYVLITHKYIVFQFSPRLTHSALHR